MHFPIAASIIAGVAAVATGNVDATATNNVDAADVSTHTADIPDKSSIPRRLLQRLKRRKDAATFTRRNQNQSGGKISDVGILTTSAPRFLQDSDYEYYCPRDTCPTELCDCADSGGSLEDCTNELQTVCRAGKLSDCVYAAYVKVYEEVYCPFVSCVDQGFREDQCDCAFYELYCSRLKSDDCAEIVNVNTDDADFKPFFGCDETSVATVCDQATVCKNKGDLQGLDLGTWKGAVATGIMENSGENFGTVNVLAGVTLMSMIWLMVNT